MKLLASTVGVNVNSYNLGFLDIDNNKSISLLSLGVDESGILEHFWNIFGTWDKSGTCVYLP